LRKCRFRTAENQGRKRLLDSTSLARADSVRWRWLEQSVRPAGDTKRGGPLAGTRPTRARCRTGMRDHPRSGLGSCPWRLEDVDPLAQRGGGRGSSSRAAASEIAFGVREHVDRARRQWIDEVRHEIDEVRHAVGSPLGGRGEDDEEVEVALALGTSLDSPQVGEPGPRRPARAVGRGQSCGRPAFARDLPPESGAGVHGAFPETARPGSPAALRPGAKLPPGRQPAGILSAGGRRQDRVGGAARS
jgi:hypothetical protein